MLTTLTGHVDRFSPIRWMQVRIVVEQLATGAYFGKISLTFE